MFHRYIGSSSEIVEPIRNANYKW